MSLVKYEVPINREVRGEDACSQASNVPQSFSPRPKSLGSVFQVPDAKLDGTKWSKAEHPESKMVEKRCLEVSGQTLMVFTQPC